MGAILNLIRFAIGNVWLVLGIAAAVAALAFGSWAYGYTRGHAAATAQCETHALQRRIGELSIQLANAKESAEFAAETMRQQSARDAERSKRIADYEAKLKAVDGCVVPLDAREWMRNARRRR